MVARIVNSFRCYLPLTVICIVGKDFIGGQSWSVPMILADQLVISLTGNVTGLEITPNADASVRKRRRPTSQSVGQRDAIDLNLGPLRFGNDVMSNACRTEDRWKAKWSWFESGTEGLANWSDVVPLVFLFHVWRNGNVVGIKLEKINLPLKDE